MSPNRMSLRLSVGLLVLLVGWPAVAQDMKDLKLFAPADVSAYGSGPKPKEGYFFAFDVLHWSISAPDTVPVGFPDLSRNVFYSSSVEAVQYNSVNTGALGANFTGGNRIELGRITDRQGWLLSTYRLKSQRQTSTNNNADVVFQDINQETGDGYGHLEGYVADMIGYDGDQPFYANLMLADLPVSFDELQFENRVDHWSVELMYLLRARPLHGGGIIELFAGVRYLEFDGTFSVNARGTEDPDIASVANARFAWDGAEASSVIGVGTLLADSHWSAEADNHIIGPQIGARWYKKRRRWTLSAEGRLFAGFNSQNIRTRGVLGTELDQPPPFEWEVVIPEDPNDPVLGTPIYPFTPILREPYNFDHSEYVAQWSPGAELRVDFIYQLTRSVSFKVGWQGFWMDGIARASSMLDYTISDASVMGINSANNNQDVFTHGLSIGFNVNR